MNFKNLSKKLKEDLKANEVIDYRGNQYRLEISTLPQQYVGRVAYTGVALSISAIYKKIKGDKHGRWEFIKAVSDKDFWAGSTL